MAESMTDVWYHLFEMADGRRIMSLNEFGPAMAIFHAIEYVERRLADDPVIVAQGTADMLAVTPEQIGDGAELVARGFHIKSIWVHQIDGQWFTSIGPWTHP